MLGGIPSPGAFFVGAISPQRDHMIRLAPIAGQTTNLVLLQLQKKG